MNVLYEAALEARSVFDDRGWKYCIIGGLAVARWGRPRATRDVDISLLTGFGHEGEYVDWLLQKFQARIADARQFALEARVLLVKATNQVPLDIVLAAFPYEEKVQAGSSEFEFLPGVSLRTVSAEDLVVLKAFAARDQDWVDVKGILARQGNHLDWEYVIRELTPLCELKRDDASLVRLQELKLLS